MLLMMILMMVITSHCTPPSPSSLPQTDTSSTFASGAGVLSCHHLLCHDDGRRGKGVKKTNISCHSPVAPLIFPSFTCGADSS
uniref:Putative secreted protein n=1 Tax=Anopheles darlingi TaxID=43151 RepID=A0A2M4DIN6_ANODA